MGVGDVSLKKWLGKKERFADLFNGTVFGGDHVVHSEELKEAPREHDIIIKDKNNKARVVQRYRDIIMNWHGTMLAVLAIESQEKVNYIMPVRSMIYDGLAYMEQIDKAWNELPKEQRAKVKKEEFISKYRKGQKLTPAITLVFYYGSKKWDGAKDIYDMLGINKKHTDMDALKDWIPNYHINLIDVNDINNIKNFEKDLQTMFGMLKYKKDKNKLRNYMCRHAEYFNSLDEYGYGTVAALLGEGERFLDFVSKELKELKEQKEHKEREEEVPIVCKAIDDIYNDGIKLGKREGIKIGEKRGEERGRAETRTQIAKNMLEQGMGLKEVVAFTKITKKEKEALVAELQIV